jgi:hypothetical protein
VSVLVVERSIASALGREDIRAVVVGRHRRWPGARGRWAPLRADDVVEALDTLDVGALGLCRPPFADPGAGPLVGVLDALGIARVVLPADRHRAVWVVGTVARVVSEGRRGLRRRAEAIASLGAADAALPVRGWGPAPLAVPAIRPSSLARWALGAWSACPRCGRGGVMGGPCGGCGARLGAGT